MKIKDINVKSIDYTDDSAIVTDDKNSRYVVVMFNPYYGAALSCNKSEMPNIHTNPELAKLVLMNKDINEIEKWFADNDLCNPFSVDYELVPYGEYYYISEYGGAEVVVTQKDMGIAK